MAGMNKEESEQVEEDIQKTSTGYIHHARPGVYGGSAKEKHVVDTLRGPKKSEIEAIEKEKKMKKFSEMLDLINTHGLKALSEMIKEEPDNEQFTKELKDQEAKAAGKGKKAEVAKAAVQAVKVEEDVEQIEEISKDTLRSYVGKAEDDVIQKHKAVSNTPGSSSSLKYARQMDMYKRMGNITKAQKKMTKEEAVEVEVLDFNEVNGVKMSQLDERQLTSTETDKKEEIVKSMKKGLSGFKARYGKDAKSVMFATATKQAKGD
jgi:3'-phosphoadenosine 5'-phosphosulfate sulfotransferase